MKGTKRYRLAGAALMALAFVVGSSGAHAALKISDTAPANRAAHTGDTATAVDSITYASETLLTGSANVTEVKGDSTTYYNVGGADNLVLSAPADVGANAGDTYVVSVTLDGMVFRAPLSTSGHGLEVTDGSGSPAFNPAAGGAVGDMMAVFTLAQGTVDSSASMLNLTAQFAVSASGGSATMTITNRSISQLGIPGVSGSSTHSGNVIKVSPALDEVVTVNNLTATVNSGFRKFATDDMTDETTVGTVGSFTVSGNDTHRNAAAATTGVDLNELVQMGSTGTGADAVPNSTVSFTGDFSFASKVYVHGDADCGVAVGAATASGAPDTTLAPATGIAMRDDDGNVTSMTTAAVSLGDSTDFTGYLCIMVQGEDTDDMEAPLIPDTDAYTATASYKAIENAAIGPSGMTRTLGRINRDGVSFNIPFLTTNDKFKQRLNIVNRGGPTTYTLDDLATPGTSVTALDAASGDLPSGHTAMKVSDMIEVDGSSRASGTLTMPTSESAITVSLDIVNPESGAIDTTIVEDTEDW